MDRTEEHQQLCDDILFHIGSRPECRLWPRVVGVGRALNNYDHVISYGIPGEADLQGIMAPSGRMIAIEVKTGQGVLSDKQKTWRAMAEKFGALYIEARSLEQAIEEVDKAIQAQYSVQAWQRRQSEGE